MDEAELKAERNEEATRQEQAEVRAQKDKGNVAYRIAREVDTLVVDKRDGIIWLCDCKHTENGEDVFYIDSSDVAKGLDEVLKWRDALHQLVPVRFRVDMFFKRHRSNNHKYIPITEFDRGYSIKVTRHAKKITTAKVGDGSR